MRKPKVVIWKASWHSPKGRQVRIIRGVSKFAAKQLVKRIYNIPVGKSVHITPATSEEIAQHAKA